MTGIVERICTKMQVGMHKVHFVNIERFWLVPGWFCPLPSLKPSQSSLSWEAENAFMWNDQQYQHVQSQSVILPGR